MVKAPNLGTESTAEEKALEPRLAIEVSARWEVAGGSGKRGGLKVVAAFYARR